MGEKKIDLDAGYIVGFADGEGTFNLVKYPDGRIRPQFLLFNTNKQILDYCSDFLKELGVESNLSLRKKSIKDKLKSYRLYISVNFKRLDNLSIKARKL